MIDVVVWVIAGIMYIVLGLYVVDGCRHIKSKSIKWVIFLFHPIYMFLISTRRMWKYFRGVMID